MNRLTTKLYRLIQIRFPYHFLLLTFSLLGLSSAGMNANAQVLNDEAIQDKIIQALPPNISAKQANVDEIARAARTVVFGMEGELLKNVSQVMISLGELSQANTFSPATFEQGSPTERFYNSMINLASLRYEGLTTLDITPLSKAMIEGMDYLNNAESISSKSPTNSLR